MRATDGGRERHKESGTQREGDREREEDRWRHKERDTLREGDRERGRESETGRR